MRTAAVLVLLLGSAACFAPRAAAPGRCGVSVCAAVERVDLTLQGKTVATAFWANQCRREMTTFRGLSGTVASTGEDGVAVAAEGARDKLESFVRWCRRGPTDLALEGGKPIVGDVVYSAARGLEGFECTEELCDVELVVTDPVVEARAEVSGVADDDDVDEAELIAALIDELS